MSLADTPDPPYYAVIFANIHTGADVGSYDDTAHEMLRLAAQQPGYLGVESTRGDHGMGITVSYWESEQAIAAWKANIDHQRAQAGGRDRWYQRYVIRVARVERAYSFEP